MGAAYLAGLAVGYWNSLEEIKENWAIDQIFEPSIDPEIREKKLKLGTRLSNIPSTGQKKINIFISLKTNLFIKSI